VKIGLVSQDPNLGPGNVELELSAGSVDTKATINPPAGVSVDSVTSAMEANQAAILDNIVTQVQNVDGIDSVTTGTIGVSALAVTTEQGVATTTTTTTTRGGGGAHRAAQVCWSALAMLLVAVMQHNRIAL